MDSQLIYAYQLDGQGSGRVVRIEDIPGAAAESGVLWVHLDADHPDSRDFLSSLPGNIPSFAVDSLLAEETRPRMLQFEDSLLLNLRGVNLNENSDPEDMVSIRLWMNKNYIISSRKRKIRAVSDVVTSIESGQGPKDTGEFLCMLVSHLFKRLNETISDLDDRTDAVESELLEAARGEQREEIVSIRKQSIMFRRYISPQRDALSQLRNSSISWISTNQKMRLQENVNEVTRFIEDLDAIRERAQVIKDELANVLTEKLNKNMYVLSVIAALFLPLGFLTGLLGINVGGIPGTDTPNAFWYFSLLLVVIVVIQIWIFRKNKWF